MKKKNGTTKSCKLSKLSSDITEPQTWIWRLQIQCVFKIMLVVSEMLQLITQVFKFLLSVKQKDLIIQLLKLLCQGKSKIFLCLWVASGEGLGPWVSTLLSHIQLFAVNLIKWVLPATLFHYTQKWNKWSTEGVLGGEGSKSKGAAG